MWKTRSMWKNGSAAKSFANLLLTQHFLRFRTLMLWNNFMCKFGATCPIILFIYWNRDSAQVGMMHYTRVEHKCWFPPCKTPIMSPGYKDIKVYMWSVVSNIWCLVTHENTELPIVILHFRILYPLQTEAWDVISEFSKINVFCVGATATWAILLHRMLYTVVQLSLTMNHEAWGIRQWFYNI